MTCDRCNDIHIGQRNGKILHSCNCQCHIKPENRKPKYILFGDWFCYVCKTTHRKNQVCSA